MNRTELRTYGESLELNGLQERWSDLSSAWCRFTTNGGSTDRVMSHAYRLTKYSQYVMAERHTSTGFQQLLSGVRTLASNIIDQVMNAEYDKITRLHDEYVEICHSITTMIRDLRDLMHISPSDNAYYARYKLISAKYDHIDTWYYKLPYQNRTQRAS